MMTLNDDLIDVFSDLCGVMGVAESGNLHQTHTNNALEDAVMTPLLPLLDCVDPDGSVDVSALPADLQRGLIGRVDGEFVRELSRKVAAVIKAKFATPPLVCEEKYFTFPTQLDFANQEAPGPRHSQFTGKEAGGTEVSS